MQLLIVDDDTHLVRVLVRELRIKYQVFSAHSCEEALELVETHSFDICLIDVGLGDGSGLVLVQELRKRLPQAGLLMLTANTQLESKVRALDGGADDYVAKPFTMVELEARIRAVSRRVVRTKLVSAAELKKGGYFLGSVRLRQKEYELFMCLERHLGAVCPRDELIEEVWPRASIQTNVLDVHITHLRKALDESGVGLSIRTVPGIGYSLYKL